MTVRVAFAGTPDFARDVLAGILSASGKLEIVGVFSQPPRPKGRGRAVEPSPVSAFARGAGLPLFEPVAWDDAADEALRQLGAACLLTCAYGIILPRRAIEATPHGAWNIHLSLLPRWRGAAPVQRAIEAGDAETGVTLFRIVERLDAGPIAGVRSFPIGPGDTSEDVLARSTALSVELAAEVLGRLGAEGGVRTEAQDESLATRARKLSKQEGELSWGSPARELDRRIRAFHPWPGARFGELRVRRSRLAEGSGIPGRVISLDPLVVAAGEGAVALDEVQRPGGRAMSGAEYARGRRLEIGDGV